MVDSQMVQIYLECERLLQFEGNKIWCFWGSDRRRQCAVFTLAHQSSPVQISCCEVDNFIICLTFLHMNMKLITWIFHRVNSNKTKWSSLLSFVWSRWMKRQMALRWSLISSWHNITNRIPFISRFRLQKVHACKYYVSYRSSVRDSESRHEAKYCMSNVMHRNARLSHVGD